MMEEAVINRVHILEKKFYDDEAIAQGGDTGF